MAFKLEGMHLEPDKPHMAQDLEAPELDMNMHLEQE